jgi:hypothetical protein
MMILSLMTLDIRHLIAVLNWMGLQTIKKLKTLIVD